MINTDSTQSKLQAILDKQRHAFMAEGEVAYGTRIDRLDRCIAILVDNQDQICEALNKDFGGRSLHFSLMAEIFTCMNTLKNSKKQLKKWMKPSKRQAPIPLNFFGATARLHYQPKGVVGLMTPWNVPVSMVFGALADILSAGNRCMIKPSEFTPATSELMAELFNKYFDETEICVLTGGPEIGAVFSSLELDHIIFTGGGAIGKMVMKAAAENLTPVTLELGGKSPVIISNKVKLKDAAEKLMAGKSMNSGQLCISPDYVFIPEAKLEKFIQSCEKVFKGMFPTLLDNPDVVSIINERHKLRIQSYIDDAKEKGARVIELNPANEDFTKQTGNKLPLHLIINPSDDMLCMQEEIFGPILNIKSYQNFDDTLSYINARPHPLALYYFGKDSEEEQRVLKETIAGGVSINDVLMHFTCDDMPFGGVGPSGMGSYHGFEGFKTFSHAKPVFKQGKVNLGKLAGTLPPYGDKMEKMIRGLIKK